MSVETTGAALELSAALREMLERASPPAERMFGPFETGEPDAASAARMAEWLSTAAAGSETAFDKRLGWDGLDAETATRALSRARLRPGAPLPGWAATFVAAYGGTEAEVAASFAALPPGPDRAQREAAPAPFETLFVPLISHARTALAARAGAALGRVQTAALASLEASLLRRLSHICVRALYTEFTVFRSVRQQGSLSALFGGAGPGGGLYGQFEGEMRSGGLLRFFRTYPVAARLAATATALWVDACAEFVAHLDADAAELDAVLGQGAPLGELAEARADLSDPHEGGRSVFILRFASGVRVVYKPRPIGMEVAFARLLEWVEQRGGLLPLRRLAVVTRPTHGWIEFAEGAPCADTAQVADFYRRCGMLLALVYGVNGSDFHLENLIAVGANPVLIDMEGLLSHRFDLEEQLPGLEMGAAEVARRAIERSVLRVYMLPALKVGNEGQALDMGGMAGAREGVQPVEIQYWKDVNTDGMKLGRRQVPMKQEGKNLPELAGERVDAGGYVPQVVEGFRHTYRLLLRHAAELLGPGSVLEAMRGHPVRFLFRHTSLYGAAIERTLHPRHLRDGADRAVQLDALSRPLLAVDSRPPMWSLLAEEHRAMERMDIPMFTALTDSRTLVLPSGEALPDCFQATAYDEALARVASLDEADLELQTGLVHAAFAGTAARELRARPCLAATDVPADSGSIEPKADVTGLGARAVKESVRVAEWLRRAALVSPEGQATWLANGYLPRARRHGLGSGTASLLDGYLGTALFLAALERVAPGSGYRDLAMSAAGTLTGRLPELERFSRFRKTMDVGAGTGFASSAYALVRIAGLLGQDELLETARGVAALITPHAIESDAALDVVSGSAGAALGFMAVHRATGDGHALEMAVRCGTHLLSRRMVDGETGLGVWPTRNGKAETGFAHGQSGIAHALLRLSAATGDAAYADAAAEALEHERRVLGADFGGAVDDEALAAWSAGATGLGMARLGAPDTAETRAVIEAALAHTRAHLDHGVDDLCAGVMGRADFLLAAAARLGRPELADEARAAAVRVIARAEARGRFRTGWGDEGYRHPGLFQGEAGVAYGLLRACHPELLPSVLLWD